MKAPDSILRKQVKKKSRKGFNNQDTMIKQTSKGKGQEASILKF